MDQKETQSSQSAFERRRYMNLLVHKARHPQLNHYIHHSVTALVPYIQQVTFTSSNSFQLKRNNLEYYYQGLIERVAVIFFKDDKIPEERFMLKINVNGGGGTMEEYEYGELRSLLMKLSLSESLCKEAVVPQGTTPKSKNCRWEISAYFSSVPETGMWVPSNTQQWQQPPLITPIKSMNTHPLSVQLYLEHPNTETAKR